MTRRITDGARHRPQITMLDSAEQVTHAAARRILDYIATTPDPVLGLATGRTPLAVYAALVGARRRGVSFAAVTSFNLDEYRGLAADHPASFAAYMRRELVDHIDIRQGHVPSGLGNAEAIATDYECQIAAAGGIGLQLLGIGVNGHIGFNEPGSPFDSRTRKVRLTEATQRANDADFPPGTPVPDEAITMGIATILSARQILLLATGRAKRDALRCAFGVSPDPSCPASALQYHPHVVLICDRAAAEGLA